MRLASDGGAGAVEEHEALAAALQAAHDEKEHLQVRTYMHACMRPCSGVRMASDARGLQQRLVHVLPRAGVRPRLKPYTILHTACRLMEQARQARQPFTHNTHTGACAGYAACRRSCRWC